MLLKSFTNAFHILPPEEAHALTIKALKSGAFDMLHRPIPADLKTSVFGLDFESPVGLAPGFDKNAEIPHKMRGLGFGFAEVGTITPQPQVGNPKPRVFRLRHDKAVVNRLGFNGLGADIAYKNIEKLRARGKITQPLGINVGANKNTEDKAADYVCGVQKFGPLADYLTVNISSPNTKGLRDLQSGDNFRDIVERVLSARETSGAHPPVLFKLAPDLTQAQIEELAAAALEYKLDGLILTNTTISRPDSLRSAQKLEQGGLSGLPLKVLSLQVLKDFSTILQGKVPLVAVGGISSAADVRERLENGASLVQLYTALVYEGPGLVHGINKELAAASELG